MSSRVMLLTLVCLLPAGWASLAECLADDLAAQEEQAMKKAVLKAQSAVVRIETFGGLETVGQVLVGTGPTTGVVVSPDGYIVSSAFNFVQNPASILVTLADGERVAAKIVARDKSRMIVLLKVEAKQTLAIAEHVPRSEMVVGQWAIALGKTLDAVNASMSAGILSATDRIWGKAIQTDAKISPANYGGPLIDIGGRVMGILVPLSPQGKNEVAGAEWYDSGIGFAIPLDDILRRLDKLKKGEDLLPGLLGVSLKGSDIYADEVVISACPPNGPAAKAGLKPDDKIVDVDGFPITRQAQLRHALGRKYAGETVQIAVIRAEQRIEKAITLSDRLDPYAHPFLGILPRRDSNRTQVRFVYEQSPADEGGIQVGDVIDAIGDYKLEGPADLRQRILTFSPGDTVRVELTREGASKTTEVTLATLPTDYPPALPAARTARPDPVDVTPPLGKIEVKIPEESGKCMAYVPKDYHPEVSCSLVVWLHPPDKYNQDRLLLLWKDLCDEHNVILLAPQSSDPAKWQKIDGAFIRKAIEDITKDYNVDQNRVLVHGDQAGGAMAYLFAFDHRDLVRAIAVVDSTFPGRTPPPANDPAHRLAISLHRAADSRVAKRIDADAKRLGLMKYPVVVHDLGATSRSLNAQERVDLLVWLDSLDRI